MSTSNVRPPIGQTVLDAEKRRKILALLTLGCSRRVAAAYVGCAPSTITRTAQRDPEFGQQVTEAERNLEIEGLSVLRRVAKEPKYWRAYAWLLERNNRQDYAPPTVVRDWPAEFGLTISRLVDVLVEDLSLEDQEKVLLKLKEIIEECQAASLPIYLEEHPELLETPPETAEEESPPAPISYAPDPEDLLDEPDVSAPR